MADSKDFIDEWLDQAWILGKVSEEQKPVEGTSFCYSQMSVNSDLSHQEQWGWPHAALPSWWTQTAFRWVKPDVSLPLFAIHSFLSPSEFTWEWKAWSTYTEGCGLWVGKYCPKGQRRERGEGQGWPAAQSSQELIDVQHKVLEPKRGPLFYQEAWLRGNVRTGHNDLVLMPHVGR